MLILRGDFSEPNRGFNRFDLTEKGTNADKAMIAPMFQEAGCFGADLPLGFWQGAPLGDVAADFVDNRRGIILLFLGGKASPLIEYYFLLSRRVLVLLRLGDWREKVRAPALFKDALSRLPLAIQLPMLLRALIRRIQDRVVKERVGYDNISASFK